MADQSISCPSCGKKIPLTRALRAEIESAARERYEQTLREREHELRSAFDRQLRESLEQARIEAAQNAETKLARDLDALKEQLTEQSKELEEARGGSSWLFENASGSSNAGRRTSS